MLRRRVSFAARLWRRRLCRGLWRLPWLKACAFSFKLKVPPEALWAIQVPGEALEGWEGSWRRTWQPRSKLNTGARSSQDPFETCPAKAIATEAIPLYVSRKLLLNLAPSAQMRLLNIFNPW